MAIVTKTIEGYGPYAYRVEYVEQDEQQWQYLGPVGQVDPADLSEDEIDDLRDERMLSRFRETTNAEFASRVVANEVRDELVDRYGEGVLALADDRRSTVVRVAEEAPRAAGRLAEQQAKDDREAARTVGQAELTNAERETLDFGETNIMHARAAKAVIQDEGIDDWTSVYDPTTTVDSQREIAQQNRESIQGDRLDEETDNVSLTREQADSQLEKRAIDAAADGIDEAADQLRDEFGYTDTEIEAITA